MFDIVQEAVVVCQAACGGLAQTTFWKWSHKYQFLWCISLYDCWILDVVLLSWVDAPLHARQHPNLEEVAQKYRYEWVISKYLDELHIIALIRRIDEGCVESSGPSCESALLPGAPGMNSAIHPPTGSASSLDPVSSWCFSGPSMLRLCRACERRLVFHSQTLGDVHVPSCWGRSRWTVCSGAQSSVRRR